MYLLLHGITDENNGKCFKNMMMYMRSSLLGLLALAAVGNTKSIVATIVEGYWSDFKYVTSFGFDLMPKNSRAQPAKLSLRSWTFMEHQKLLVFRDAKWFEAYNDRASCTERAALADYIFSVPAGGFYGQAAVTIELEPSVEGEPQFWYIALARCRAWMPKSESHVPDGIFMYFDAELTNPGLDQFSVDEQNLLMVHYVFTALYSALLVIFLAIAMRQLCQMLRAKRLVVPAPGGKQDTGMLGFIGKVQLFASLLALFIAHHSSAILHLFVYRGDGVGHPWAAITSEALGHAATMLLTLSLLWVSLGYMITVSNLKPTTRVIQTVISCVYVVLYATSVVVEFVMRDVAVSPKAVAPHEALAARLLIALRCALMLLFVRNVRHTMAAEAELAKATEGAGTQGRAGARNFYRIIRVAGSLWFLSVPLWHLVTLGVPHYMRRQVFDVASACGNIALLAILVIRGTTSFAQLKAGEVIPSAADDMLPVSVVVQVSL